MGTEYTFESSQAKTIIDITLSAGLSLSVTNWRVDKSLNFSDHNSIVFELQTEMITPKPRRPWHKADWNVFKQELRERSITLRETITEQRMEKALDKFYTNINKALDEACPKEQPKVIDKNNPWWTPELQTERKALAKLYKTKCRHPTAVNIAIYKQNKTTFARHCRQAQTKGWNSFTADTDSLEKMNVLRKIMEGHTTNTIGTLEKQDGSITDPGVDTISTLISTHFPDATDTRPTEYHDKIIYLSEVKQANIDWIRPHLVARVFDNFKSKKSPGTDELKPIVYKNLTDTYYGFLTDYYKSMIIMAFTPTIWKEVKLIFIPNLGNPPTS